MSEGSTVDVDSIPLRPPKDAASYDHDLDEAPLKGSGASAYNISFGPDAFPPGAFPEGDDGGNGPDAGGSSASVVDTSSLSLDEKAVHKQFKVRMDAYDTLAQLFSKARKRDDPVFAENVGVVRKALKKETNALAMDKALDALLALLDKGTQAIGASLAEPLAPAVVDMLKGKTRYVDVCFTWVLFAVCCFVCTLLHSFIIPSSHSFSFSLPLPLPLQYSRQGSSSAWSLYRGGRRRVRVRRPDRRPCFEELQDRS